MSATTQLRCPTITPVAPRYDDPDGPGLYLTDGEQLYRLLRTDAPRQGFVELEDCATLDVVVVHRDELRAWDMRPVRAHEPALVAA